MKFRLSQIKIICFLILMILPGLMFSHQPHLVYKKTNSFENSVKVHFPQISKAYYGRMKDGKEYYIFETMFRQEIFLSLLVPDISDIPNTNICLSLYEISSDGLWNSILYLDGESYQWQPYYEKYGGHHYYKGPEIRKTLDSGQYLVEISNRKENGPYVFSVGEAEFFGPVVLARLYFDLQALNREYFIKEGEN